LNLWPRVSLPETSPTLRWTGKVGDASVFRGPAPSGVSQVDHLPGTAPVQVAVVSGAAPGAVSGGAASGGAEPGPAGSDGAGSGGAELEGVEPGGAESEGAEPGGAESEGAESGGAKPRGAASSGDPTEPGAAGAGGAGAGVAGVGGPGAEGMSQCYSLACRFGGGGCVASPAPPPSSSPTAAAVAEGGGCVGALGLGFKGGAVGVELGFEQGSVALASVASELVAPVATGPVPVPLQLQSLPPIFSPSTVSPPPHLPSVISSSFAYLCELLLYTCLLIVLITPHIGYGGTGAARAGAVDPGAGGAGGTVRPRPYFVPLLQQVLGVPSSTGLPPPFLCPAPDQSQPPLQPASPLPVPSPYTEQSGGLTEFIVQIHTRDLL
ncbi:unnamed protein product, partial [Closterium sp. NIES-54]